MRTLKLAFLLSSVAASAAVFAQNATPPQQSPAAKAPAAKPAQVTQQAPAAGAQAAGAAAGQTSTEPAGLAGMGVPGAIAARLTTIGAAAQNNETSTPATHH